MKIVYLHQHFRTRDMAGGTRSYEMARRLADQGHDVHVVTADDRTGTYRGWMTREYENFVIHSVGVPYGNDFSVPQRMAAFFAFALRASARARRLRGDIVYASSTPLTIAIPGLVATWGRSSPLVLEVRDLWPSVPIALGVLKGRWSKLAARLLERVAYSRSEHIVALSKDMAAGVERTGRARAVTVIPNSCDNDLFNVAPEVGQAFRRNRAWLGDRPLVVYTGTFGRVNGLSYMVDLASEMQLIDPEIVFLAVGDGAEVELVEKHAANRGVLGRNFFIEPPVPKTEIPAVLSAATVCTSWVINVPELEANSANKVFDGLAARRPIVINHGGWLRELIADTGVGLVLDPEDLSMAARDLQALLRSDSRLKEARTVADSLANGDFSRDHLASLLNACLIRTLKMAQEPDS